MENAGNLSPIVEESESTLCCEEPFSTVSALKECGCKMIRPSCNEYRSTSRETKGNGDVEGCERFRFGGNSSYGLDALKYKKSHLAGDSSSGDELAERDYYRFGRFKNSYCRPALGAFLKEAKASGDNDEAETGRRDRSPKTTVEQFKCRLSQVERKIVALKRYQNPRKCQGHEKCEALRKDLQAWRVDHEKRIDSRIVRWQLAERRRTYGEMEKTWNVYDDIQRHLETLERQSTESYLNFQRQIDAWEKRLKNEIITLYEDNLMELREQLRTWLEIQNAVNSPNVQREKDDTHKLGYDTITEKQRESDTSNKSKMTTSYQDNAEFLHKIEHIINFKVQQQCDDVVKRTDRKIAELRSVIEDFKHNFCLDRHYLGQDYNEINDKTEKIVTEEASDFTCQESARSDLNTDS